MSNAETFHKQPVERRTDSRRACLLRGDLITSGGRGSPVAVMDLTADGARVAMQRPMLLPTRLTLRLSLSEGSVLYDAELLWRSGLNAGLALSGRREDLGPGH
ncbi:hypothetical protein CSW58_00450 [Caulobacter sp. B11]|uniref:hypothetical protein n=1 Tax=Caulobacter sp. B11 TaxID=2048899 RepID=UPI000C12C462|nr:hypothetical protein [Caulobacter sp. B11]PHY14258.1 hypothetical protein CSW58_00450 [Caulobacter sp. B11]